MNCKVFSIITMAILLSILVSTGAAYGDVARLPGKSDSASIALGQPGTSFRYVKSFGTLGEPYLADTIHINRPLGLFIDNNSNLYVTEERGHRVLQYSSSKVNLLALGTPGQCNGDDVGFCTAKDVAVDKDGNLWVVDPHRAVQYNQAGVFLQQFPDTDSWMSGSGNDRFNDPNGIAFDSTGRMYISDYSNHRIQVFDMTTGTPVYSTTIGMTNTPGVDPGYFDLPMRIAIDSSNRLYVVELGNNRLQRCSYSSHWTCTVLDSTLNRPQGIAIDSSGRAYIADTENWRIRRCTSDGTCSNFVTGTKGYTDVAVDSAGNVYAAAPWEAIIEKYNSSGIYQGVYLGVLFVPYLTDNNHYNNPRVAIDPSNNILIIEGNGHRLVKLDPNGNFLWSFGVPGVDADDNTHLGYPHSVATDNGGNVYVAGGCQVKIISSAGVYMGTLGTGCGTGDYQFGWASGVDVDKNGNIYVADYHNHRVQIYNSSRIYLASIGATGECSSANDRLCNPIAVDVDANGNIYVTDSGNLRVQKFNSSRVWQMTIGDGTWGSSFDQLSWPEDIVVDAQGKIYITDWNNNRVQVFDASGAYLTTIAGSWGTRTSELKGACGVDIDRYGNVYVADSDNFRIQKFAPGVPGWQQININGFGNRLNGGIPSLEVFQDQLYAGVGNWDEGTQVWRTGDGTNWSQVSDFGFSETYGNSNPAVIDMIVFNNQLYAGVGWDGIEGQVWRSPDGTSWEQVIGNGFGNSDNFAVATFGIYNNKLYAATGNDNGIEIWTTTTGNASDWEWVVIEGNGNANNRHPTGFIQFGSDFYLAVENEIDGAEIWRTSNGTSWSRIATGGFGNPDNIQTGGLAVLGSYLYVGTRNDSTGAQIYRTSTGTSWDAVVVDGFGDSNNYKVQMLFAYEGRLFAGTDNSETGVEIWKSDNGITWAQVNPDGFGDSNNSSTLWSVGTTVFKNMLVIATWNSAGNGGEIWMMLKNLYLPLIKR